MQQYNEQFMNRYMLPLLGEVVTDMAKGEKNRFLGKLLQGEQIMPLEKDEFVRYYFENRQDQNRKSPFLDTTPEQNKKFWYAFTDEFSKYMVLRFHLSGTEGTRTAFFPGEDGGFTQEVTKNMYDLAYRITNDFEQERIAQLIKKEEEAARAAGDSERLAKAAADRELLNAGKLKLVLVDGVEQYISEEQAKNAAASTDPVVKNMKMTPAVGVGLGKMKDPEAAAEALESGAGISAGGAVNAGGASTGGADETAGFADLQNDFISSSAAASDKKYEDLVTGMADNGLQIVPNTFRNPQGQWNIDEKGFLNGEVKDRKGQRMKVKINPALGAKDPDKFEFTFIGGTAPNGAPLDGLSFKASENDLKDFKDKDAFAFAQPQLPERAKEKQGAPLPGERPGGAGLPGPTFDLRMGKPTLEGGPGMPEIKGEVGVRQPSVGIPAGAKVRERMPATGAGQPAVMGQQQGLSVSGRTPAQRFQKPIGPRPVPPATVAARKRAVREQRAQMPGAQMSPSFEQPGAGAVAARPKRKGKKYMKILAGTTAAELALLGAGAAGAANGEDPAATSQGSLLNMIANISDTFTHALTNMFLHAAPQPDTALVPDMLTHLSFTHGFAHDLTNVAIRAVIAHFTGGSFFV